MPDSSDGSVGLPSSFEMPEMTDPVVHVQLSKAYMHTLSYVINSIEVPMSAAIVITLVLAAVDCFKRQSLSPQCFGPVCLFSVLLIYRVVAGNDRTDVRTRRGKNWNISASRCMYVSPYVYTFVILHIKKERAEPILLEVMTLVPVWLGVFAARNWREAVAFLSLHFVIILPIGVAENEARFVNLFLIDILLCSAAWLKGHIIFIVDQITFAQDRLVESVKSVGEQQNSSSKAEQTTSMPMKLGESETRYRDKSSVATAAVE